MRRKRVVVYSLLALPFLAFLAFTMSLDQNARRGFLNEFVRNSGQLVTGRWEWPSAVRRHVRRGFRLRGYGQADPSRLFERLDADENGILEDHEAGRRLYQYLISQADSKDGIIRSDDFVDAWFGRRRPVTTSAPVELPVGQAPSPLSADALLAPDHVLQVDIRVAPEDWRQLCRQSRDWHSAVANPLDKPYTYFPADIVVDGVPISRVAIRKKGFIGSQDNTRPSLKVKFDEYVEQAPVEGLDRLTLNNNRQDSGLISQALTYWLFRRAGVAAPRANFAAVTVNGTYLGVYTNVESIRKPFLQRSFGDDSGTIYEGTLADIYPKALEWMEPKNKHSDKNQESLAELANVLDENAPSLSEIEALIDLDNFLRYWALETLIRFWDGYTFNQNNYFVYFHPKEAVGYFIPWGADSCFGQHGRNRGAGAPYAVKARSMLSNRLYHLPGIPDRYRQVMRELLQDVWVESEILEEIERLEGMLRDHVDMGQLSSLFARDEIRHFVERRREIVTTDLDHAWPVDVGVPVIPMYWEPIGKMQGHFRMPKLTAVGSDPSETKLRLTLEDEQLELDRLSTTWMRLGPDATKPRPNVVNIQGRQEGRPFNLSLKCVDDSLQLGEPVKVQGRLDGLATRFWSRRHGHPMRGHVTLRQSPDGLITAELDLTVCVRHDRQEW